MHTSLTDYTQNLKKDLPAGLVVFLVALPLCLGISLASGAPLFSGILTGIVGGILVSMLSGSSLSVSGPAAGLTVIVADAIHELKSFETFLLAGFIAGILQLGLGYAKAGVIGMYFPASVIRGMLAAIGLTLILKQIPHFVGVDKDAIGEMSFRQPDGETTFSELSGALQHVDLGALIIGVISLGILLAWDSKPLKKFQFFKLVPGALIVVLGSVLIHQAFIAFAPHLVIEKAHLVGLPVLSTPGDIVQHLRFPAFSQIGNSSVWVVAVTIAIIASLESLLSVEAVDKLDPLKRKTPPNRELKAQGAGNIVASLIGGLPLTAVIVRSSANINAGGQTRVSAFFHGILLLASVFFLAKFINLVPLSALAAVLLVVGYKLTTPALFKAQWKLGWNQFIPFCVTIAAIMFTDLLIGVSIGLAVGLFFVLKAHYKFPFSYHKEEHPSEPAVHIQLSPTVSFLNKAAIMSTLHTVPARSKVTIDGSNSHFIDYDILDAIQQFKHSAVESGIQVHLIGIPEVATAPAH